MFVATQNKKHDKISIYFWTEEVYLSSLKIRIMLSRIYNKAIA